MKSTAILSDRAKNITPYMWEQPIMENSLRFESNTLPFAPPSIKKFLKEMNKSCPINEYADPSYARLKKLLAAYERIPESYITITNSGDEAIDVLAKACLNPGDYFVTTPPTYEMFSIQCSINNGQNYEVPLTNTFEVNDNEVIHAANNVRTKLIFLVNPNNPTGTTIPNTVIENILGQSPGVVVVDEAYGEFYGKTVVPLVRDYDNLVILKSFSKFAGLAGARIGYLIANPTLSSVFETIRFPMGVSYLSYKLAETVLEHDQNWIKKQTKLIRSERSWLTRELEKLGLYVFPSKANFLLVRFGDNARNLCTTLKEKGVLVRDRSAKPFLSGCVRITVRSPKENNQLIETLQSIL